MLVFLRILLISTTSYYYELLYVLLFITIININSKQVSKNYAYYFNCQFSFFELPFFCSLIDKKIHFSACLHAGGDAERQRRGGR